MHFVKLASVVTSCLAIRSAAAQPAPAPAPAPAQSVLPGMLSTAAGTTFDARIDFTKFDEGSGFDGPTVLGLNLHAQYLSPAGLGGYLSLPISYLSGDGDSEVDLGNTELGGLYAFRNQNLDAYVRGGLALKQTSTAEDELGLLVPLASFVPRPSDAAATGFGTSWVRGGAGVRLTNGALVFGATAGVDVPFAADDGNDLDLNSLLHLSGSIGVAQPGFGFAVGATVLTSLEDSDGDNSNVYVQALGDVPAGVRARVYGAVGFAPEDGFDAFSIGVGVRTSM